MVLSLLRLPQSTEQILRWLRWPTVTVVTLLGLAFVYHYGPARPPGRWRWVTLGSAVATVLWLAGSTIFSRLAARFGQGDLIDGSLAVVITILTWFLLSAYVVILGAELNVGVLRRGQLIGLDALELAADIVMVGAGGQSIDDGQPRVTRLSGHRHAGHRFKVTMLLSVGGASKSISERREIASPKCVMYLP